jgi:hypothetical protein
LKDARACGKTKNRRAPRQANHVIFRVSLLKRGGKREAHVSCPVDDDEENEKERDRKKGKKKKRRKDGGAKKERNQGGFLLRGLPVWKSTQDPQRVREGDRFRS